MHGTAIWQLCNVNYQAAQRRTQNLKYHLIGGEFLSSPFYPLVCPGLNSTQLETWKWAPWCRQKEVGEKPLDLAQGAENSPTAQREWKKPPAYFLLLFLHFLMHQPPGNSAVRVAKAERGQQQETTGIKTLREGDIPLHLVKLQEQKGRSNTVAFMFSLSPLMPLGPGGRTVIEVGGFWLEEWKGATGSWKVLEEGWCSGMQPHKVVCDLLGSSVCTCMDLILISMLKIWRMELMDRTPSRSQTDHWVAHLMAPNRK